MDGWTNKLMDGLKQKLESQITLVDEPRYLSGENRDEWSRLCDIVINFRSNNKL